MVIDWLAGLLESRIRSSSSNENDRYWDQSHTQ